MDGNRLTGTIPSWLGRLTGVTDDFELARNSLTGTIPTQLGLLTGARVGKGAGAATGSAVIVFGIAPHHHTLTVAVFAKECLSWGHFSLYFITLC